jgi:excisionase family DNA binding protein
MEVSERLLTVSEVAKILALRPGTIRAWCYQRRLSRVLVGKRSVRIPASEVRRIIREGSESLTNPTR